MAINVTLLLLTKTVRVHWHYINNKASKRTQTQQRLWKNSPNKRRISKHLQSDRGAPSTYNYLSNIYRHKVCRYTYDYMTMVPKESEKVKELLSMRRRETYYVFDQPNLMSIAGNSPAIQLKEWSWLATRNRQHGKLDISHIITIFCSNIVAAAKLI